MRITSDQTIAGGSEAGPSGISGDRRDRRHSPAPMNTRNSPAKSFAIDLQVERVSRYRGILRTVPKAFGAQWTSRGRWFTRTYRNVSEGGLKRERLGISGLAGRHDRARVTPRCPFVCINKGDDRACILQATVQTTSYCPC
jgi:hypothetical protein